MVAPALLGVGGPPWPEAQEPWTPDLLPVVLLHCEPTYIQSWQSHSRPLSNPYQERPETTLKKWTLRLPQALLSCPAMLTLTA